MLIPPTRCTVHTDQYSIYSIYFIVFLIFYLFRVVIKRLKQHLSDELREMARQEILAARESTQGRPAQLLVKQP